MLHIHNAQPSSGNSTNTISRAVSGWLRKYIGNLMRSDRCRVTTINKGGRSSRGLRSDQRRSDGHTPSHARARRRLMPKWNELMSCDAPPLRNPVACRWYQFLRRRGDVVAAYPCLRCKFLMALWHTSMMHGFRSAMLVIVA
ncbi:hypothetical protein [Lysobacter gummosus]|uniref:hypothetical protein n=1 Tax=Lysobacter gummosus TaxID=262324 RepID=UPI0036432B1F